jgi:hypothetical protein
MNPDPSVKYSGLVIQLGKPYLCVLTVWRLAEDLSGLYLARAGAHQRGRGSAPQSAQKNLIKTLTHKKAVLRIQIRIRIRRIHIFLALPERIN